MTVENDRARYCKKLDADTEHVCAGAGYWRVLRGEGESSWWIADAADDLCVDDITFCPFCGERVDFDCPECAETHCWWQD